jgi:lipoate---protein ligase
LSRWRLLDTGSRSAAENMALDEVLLVVRSLGLSPNTVRFLQFSPACVLVGYHQIVAQEIRSSFCREHGIDINRRITGGGALFWDTNQLGWEIIGNRDYPGLEPGLERLYAQLGGIVAHALRALGVKAAFRPRNDIEVRGRKISGTGGTELGSAFLFQGTLLNDFDVDTMLRALRIPTEKLQRKEIESLRERVTCLKWELRKVPPLDAVKKSISRCFARELGMELEEGGLLPVEEQLLAERLPHFGSAEWIEEIEAIEPRVELRAGRRARGGFLRSSLVLGPNQAHIANLYLTGDFFSHPRRAVYDLETSCRGLPADPTTVADHVLEFFQKTGARLPGIDPHDVVTTINDALAKKDYPALGIPAISVNDLTAVVKPLEEIRCASVVLLPYCAKRPDCHYRHRQGCGMCGRCVIGQAHELAAQYGLRPITIQSFGMLSRCLKELKRAGEPAFLGTCCDAFTTKHRRDLERIGLPGVLLDVDSTTCYDLGQAAAAHAGHFANQTELKVDLLEGMMARLSPRKEELKEEAERAAV